MWLHNTSRSLAEVSLKFPLQSRMKFKNYANNGKLYFLLIISQSYIVTLSVYIIWLNNINSHILEFTLSDQNVIEYKIQNLSQSNNYKNNCQRLTRHFHIFSINFFIFFWKQLQPSVLVFAQYTNEGWHEVHNFTTL